MATRDSAARAAALNELVSSQHGLVTAAQLRALGYNNASVTHRVAGSQIWQRMLPGTYLTTTGVATDHQRRLAALLYGGPGSMLTGHAALAVHGSRVAARHERGAALLLVPHERKRSTSDYVTVERTTRWPAPLTRHDLAVAPPARAAIDAGRRMTALNDVRALLADVVQTGLAPLDELNRELRQAQRRGSRLPRLALEALGAGIRSAPEAMLRDAWLAAGMAEPLWNPTLRTPDGEFVARPDAYIPEVGLAVEVESKEFHYADADWRRTIRRQASLTSCGVVVMQVTPNRLAPGAAAEFMQDVRSAASSLGHRPMPGVTVHPR